MANDLSASQYIDAILEAGISAFSKLTIAWIKTAVPFFNLPIISQLTDMVVNKIFEIGLKYTEMGAYFLLVDLTVSKQSKDFEAATIANYKIRQTGTTEEKQNAEQDLIDKARIFIKFHSV